MKIKMKRTNTNTLIKALLILSIDIRSDDGVANAAIREAAERLTELNDKVIQMQSIQVSRTKNS